MAATAAASAVTPCEEPPFASLADLPTRKRPRLTWTEEENRIEMAVDELINYIREEKYDEARAMLEKEPTIVNGKTHVGFAA